MNWFLMAMRKYANFSGRSQRAEYWWFFLVYFLLMILAVFIDVALGLTMGESGVGVLTLVLILLLFIPAISVGVRRLHDIGRSGWWMLLMIVPFGSLVLMVMAMLDSKPETNKWGSSPKDVVRMDMNS